MANLQESAVWDEGIYQLETTDNVVGGPDGISNRQAKALANRTKYLLGLFGDKQPLDATLTALAALTVAADKLIYATGPDTFATTALTSFIRTLLDDTDAKTARKTLGAESQSLLYVEVSLANGAMTWTLPKQTLKFRNPTLTMGAPIEIDLPSDLTLTFPVGSTGGSVSNILANFVPVVFYNGGNPVLGASNLAGGLDLSEAGLLSATAISASATSASVVYASVAVTNSPYLTAGLVQSTQSTAGTWVTQPNIIPKGNNLAGALGGFWIGQKWQDVTASRALSTTYYNTKSRPIAVSIVSHQAALGGYVNINLVVDGLTTARQYFDTDAGYAPDSSIFTIVPPGSGYQATSGAITSFSWFEVML